MADYSAQLFVAKQLNEMPFNKTELTAASFVHMGRIKLLQLLNDVLEEIDPAQKANIQEEDPNQTITRILEFLRILKYMPPEDEDPEMFRMDISDGIPDVIVPLMAWILDRKDILKKRAYLAKYLVKIEYPDLMGQDVETYQTYCQYEALLGKFVEVHKEHELLTNRKSVSHLIEDIDSFRNDQECLRRKIDSMKSRMDGKLNKTFQLSEARELREANARNENLHHQLEMEERGFKEVEKRKVKLRRDYQMTANMYNAVTVEGLFEHMDDGTNWLRENVYQRLPIQMKEYDLRIRALRNVESEPPKTLDDLKYIKIKIHDILCEVKELQSRVVMKAHNEELFVARQKAMASDRRRKIIFEDAQLLSTQLSELREAITTTHEQQERRSQEVRLREKEFRKFLEKFKVKGKMYQQEKIELNYLKAETGVLSSTKFILEGKLRETEENLEELENDLGLRGFTKTQSTLETISTEKRAMDEQKTVHLQKMTEGVKDLFVKFARQKNELAPYTQAAKVLHAQIKLVQVDYDKAKDNYMLVWRETELQNDKTAQKNSEVNAQLAKLELEYSLLIARSSALKIKKKQTNLEKVYQNRDSKNPCDSRIRSMKQRLLGKIVEQERINGNLEDDIANFEHFETQCNEQRNLWMDTARILEYKLRSKRMMLTSPIDEPDNASEAGWQ